MASGWRSYGYNALAERLKRAMPHSLFGRALLILVLPTILVQIVAVTIFFDRHWDSVQRHLAASLAGEVAVVTRRMRLPESALKTRVIGEYEQLMTMDITLVDAPISTARHQQDRFVQYISELSARIRYPFIVYALDDAKTVRTEIAMDRETVQIDVGIKRLESSTTTLFVVWIVSSAVLLTVIAIAFLRNQIRPIRRLAMVAEQFGMGQDVGNFRPHGAEEVRTAGRAFVEMRTRLLRQISTRTQMLSGISHDLRTPLTRLKLQLALLPHSEDIDAMYADIDEMEAMLDEYLEFARGNDASAVSEPVDCAAWLRDIVQAYIATNAAVTYSLPESCMLMIRPLQLKRAIDNLISNALKYGERCHVSLELHKKWAIIHIDDEGEGIPPDAFDEVFRPFTRLEGSRNHETGGVGLGLAITQDIVQSHGGRIQMNNRMGGDGDVAGLHVAVLLPVPLEER